MVGTSTEGSQGVRVMKDPQDASPCHSDEPRPRGGVDHSLELTFGPRQAMRTVPSKSVCQSGGDEAGTEYGVLLG